MTEKKITWYEARVIPAGHVLKFRSLRSLAKRVGGDSWRMEHDTSVAPDRRILMITRTNQHGTHVVLRVSVPSESIG